MTSAWLAPDWYTIDWETAKSYTLNDKIGLLYYPAGLALHRIHHGPGQLE